MKLLKEQAIFLLLMLVFMIAGGMLLLNIEKGDVVIWFSQNRTVFWNKFYTYGTYFGAEAVPFIILAFLFVKFKYAIFLGAANVIVSLFVRMLKVFAFPDWPRPSKFFEDLGEIVPFVDGVHLHSLKSFPSGHAASAFALFFGISLIFHRKWLSIPLFFIALAVALSRPYLGQHFFVDIYVGSVISVVLTFLIFYWFDTRVWYGSDWANKSLLFGWDWHRRKI